MNSKDSMSSSSVSGSNCSDQLEEMLTLSLSRKSENVIQETIRCLQGSSFLVKDLSSNMDQGGNVNTAVAHDNVNIYALAKLESYGFYKRHCLEALEVTEGDVSVALEVLLSQYFKLGLKFPFITSNNSMSNGDSAKSITYNFSEILQKREDEKCVLEFIFASAFEERIANRLWVLNLQLDYLLDIYCDNDGKDKELNNQSKPSDDSTSDRVLNKKPKPKICRFFSKGKCKFAQACWFLHQPVATKHVAPKEEKKKPLFQLEIRFPEGSHYPLEPALVCLSTAADNFPAEACLQLTGRLLQKAQVCAHDEAPAVYTLADLLLSCQDEMVELLKDNSVSLLDSGSPLFSPRASSVEETCGKVQDASATASRTTKQHHQQPSLHEVLREDEIIVQKFLENQNELRYKKLLVDRQMLPVWGYVEVILEAVRRHQVVVIRGNTGCGKSTQIPQFLLDDWLLNWDSGSMRHVEIICTQPRRLSAIQVAERVAEERAEETGKTVGYQIRLASKMSSSTRLLFCTTGILLRRLQIEPHLSSVSHIIVDEVHERSEQSDFLLMILRDLLPVRPDLKVILMSATLDASLFSSYFGQAPTIEIPGRTFPVEQLFLEDILDCSRLTCKTVYLMDPNKLDYQLIQEVITWIVAGEHSFPTTGSILVFLPGMPEISILHDQLMGHPVLSPRTGKFLLIPLHSSLTTEEQAEVSKKSEPGVRKIILSTNIAETSLTIDDCVFVVDCGKMKEKRFDSRRNLESLQMVWVSRANALQRKGRAGRIMPGVCIHLFTRHHYDYVFLEQPVPELQRMPLEQIILRIKTLPHFADKDPYEVLAGALEPPADENVDCAVLCLKDAGVLDADNEVTPLGRHLATLPVDVRIGKLILFGAIFCCVDSALTIAACLSYKSPFLMSFGKKEQANICKQEFTVGNSDHLTVLKAYKRWLKICSQSHQAGQVFAEENLLSWEALVTLADIKREFVELLASIGFISVELGPRESGNDNILGITGPKLNANGNNTKLLTAIISAALYPNVVKVLTPKNSFDYTAKGALPREFAPDELQFMARDDKQVFLHPSSVNHCVSYYTSPYLVYQEKICTSCVFINGCSMVSALTLVLFSGRDLKIKRYQETSVIALEDGWIKFAVDSQEVAERLLTIRSEFVALLKEKIENPSLNLLTHEKGSLIITTVEQLITEE